MPDIPTVHFWASNRRDGKALRVLYGSGEGHWHPGLTARDYFQFYPDEPCCFVTFNIDGAEASVRFENAP